ncbi:LacI family DNA-binding transcriptional regulator [Actinomyces faecalis]|uniref:LacI family DNA-binding transcriptional regulator n=1 Tax=Actinomyces faecalis TaxID=2722820 RepID=UPI001556D6BF|nr:LacI family DNA-binding transcriptional regulator [Actinomyces faecalis]
MPPTILDVASLAGVSAKTVSRVVNDESGVSEGTRNKVLQAIRSLGYSPDRAATYLRTGRSGVIGLAVPELGQPFFAELADRITRTAAQHGLSVVLGVTGQHGEGEEEFLARHVELDGVILYWQGLEARHLSIEARRRPVVVLGENEHDEVDRVTMGNDAGIHLALAHLLALGRQHIAVLGVPEQGSPSHGAARARVHALQSATARLGTSIEAPLLVATDEWRRPEGAAAVRRLLASGHPFDAVLAFNDGLALGALHELSRQGLRVPDDVAVTGFDNLEISRFSVPSLTTVSPRLSSYADDALDLLLTRLDNPSLPARTRVEDVTLLPRDSTIGGTRPWTHE